MCSTAASCNRKNKRYYLVLVEDSQIENEYARYEFNIDIAIQNDFGF